MLEPIALDDLPEESASAPSSDAPVLPVNADVAKAMSASRVFRFRGRRYIIRPTPFNDGLDMKIISISVAEEAKHIEYSKLSIEEYRKHLAAMADAAWRVMVPVSPTARLRKRLGLMRNPLRTASEGDLMVLTDFFSALRTSSSVRLS